MLWVKGIEFEMDINESKKRATSLAKEGKYDEAIALLKKIVPGMAKIGGFGNGGYTKVIPYFQKVGRYQDGIDYSINTLIPAVEKDCSIAFSHKCKEIQKAFTHLGTSQIYDKLRLCAKREKKKDEEVLYENLSEESWQKYEQFLSVGERIELKREFEEAFQIYGVSTDSWPDVIKRRFADLINT